MSDIKIALSRRLRSTPYTSRIEKQGLSSYTIYNRMKLPAAFEDSLEDSYYHLKENVQLWCVSAERQVKIFGEDAAKFVQLMTCRDLSKSKDKRCYYAPLIDQEAGLINDPIILRISKNEFWLSIADSDVLLWAKGLALGGKYNVEVTEPDINIIALQGARSFKLMEKIFGKQITELKFFGFDYFDFRGTKHLIARSGWSKTGGYEIYAIGNQGLELYDHLFEIGKEFNIKPGCPHLIERIESGLLSWGNDFDLNDNPLECGFDNFVNLDNDNEFLGKEKLKKIKAEGVTKKLMGVKIEHDKINVTEAIDITIGSKRVGELRSGVFSPLFKSVIGIAMIDSPHFEVDTKVEIKINNETKTGILCKIPFI
tara:strand:+ start:217 stop:1323 length:1107 start_codon:yes stop_codon:yes gene_type:complete